MKAKWRDATSYSRDGARVPRTWELDLGKLRVVVTRYRGYPETMWLLICLDLRLELIELASEDLEDAKEEALSIVRACLNDMTVALERAK